MSFAQELQTLYKIKKAEILENKNEIQERRAKDSKLFFEQEILQGAKEKMRTRAEAGHPTANVLEYQYNERFYVDGDNKVVRYVDQEVNFPNYRIHDLVMRDTVFQGLLKEFEEEISSEDSRVRLSKWRPRDTLHVIEAVWGRNRHHTARVASSGGRGSFRGGPGRGRGGRGMFRGGRGAPGGRGQQQEQ